MPLQNMKISETGREWRLMYCDKKVNEYQNHVMVMKSTIDEAGDGLFANITFFEGDIISVFIGNLFLGNSSIIEISISPFKVIDNVLGIGVAVIANISGFKPLSTNN